MRSVLKLNYLLYYFFSSQGDAIEYFILNKKSISSLSLSRLNLFLSFQLPNQSIRFYSIIFKLTFYQSAFSYLAISLSLLKFSVTRFGEILPLWHNCKSLGCIFEGSFTIWQNFDPTVAKMFYYWASFHHCRWPYALK